ncbi:MAG: glycoside hydrolase family 57 protein [Deltaproteobacteria bacterium]
MVDLALVLHMHQPDYVDPLTGDALLPWVRLHASRAYYDVARLLEGHPGARIHVNLVPSLLDQLEALARGELRDRYLELSRKPAAELAPGEREQLLRFFFMVDWETEVRTVPRYWELLLKRGQDLSRVDLPAAARAASTDELRDLQLLFNLAWTGFSLRAEEPALKELLRKGRGFSEDDKGVVLGAQARALREVIPLYRALSERGTVELTATPHYHPILPLLIDTESAREALPDRPMPRRFAHPEDAREQVRRARESHARRFGAAPSGMWPAEGSVSFAAAEIFAEQGTRWIASDEGVLFRSLPAGTPRDRLYRPYRLETPGGEISMVFRDRGLSDLIGFDYAKAPAARAVEDLLGHLCAIGEGERGGERRLVSIVLDGENPWEHYPESGREFLHRLCEALEGHEGGVEPVLLRERLAERPPRDSLPRLHPGSWIEASFRIWIGHAEDRAGWEALGEVRRRFEQARADGAAPDRLDRAYDQILRAEGSDWFWWYGDDFSTENAAEFDALFRAHLTEACRALGVEIPEAIRRPLSAAAVRQRSLGGLRAPDALLRPTIDGRISVYGEWAGAGLLPAEPSRGSMYQGDPPFTCLRYGFDERCFYFRLDRTAPWPSGHTLAVEWQAAGSSGSVSFPLALGRSEGQSTAQGGGVGEIVVADILEGRLGLDELQVGAGEKLWLAVQLLSGEVVVQRFPASGSLEIDVPTRDFERIHWKV